MVLFPSLGVDLGSEIGKGNLAVGVWTPHLFCKYFARELTRYTTTIFF
jgi:hypothetical protein